MIKIIKKEKCIYLTAIKRITAFILVQMYCLMLVPARELMMEHETEAIFSERYEIEKENVSEEEKKAVEKAIKGDVICDDVFWGENNYSSQTISLSSQDTMFLIHKSRLYEILLKAKKDFLTSAKENDFSEQESLEQWNQISEQIISDYLNKYLSKDESENVEIKNEYSEMERSIYNEALTELLYDKYSMKKEADKGAAGIIAEQLIDEIKRESQDNIDVLFDRLRQPEEYDEETLVVKRDDWFESFNRYIESGIEKWQAIEEEFLNCKYNFENEVGQKYAEDIKKWANAYDELLAKKEEWTSEIQKKYEEGITLWKQKSNELNIEISKAMEDYANELFTEQKQKKEEFKVNCEMYTQTRTLLSTACNEINNWLAAWSGKYDGVYSYWKTEDGSKYEINPLSKNLQVNESNFDEILKTIQKVKNKYLTTCDHITLKKQYQNIPHYYNLTNNELKDFEQLSNDIVENKSLFISELELAEDWLNIISEYYVSLNEILNNIEKAGFDYSDNTFVAGELQTERKLLENELAYRKEKLEVAEAVYRYSSDNTSKVEKIQETKTNLENAEVDSEKARKDYENSLKEIEIAKNEYENAFADYENSKLKLEDCLSKLREAQIDYQNLKMDSCTDEFDEIKNDYLSLVNSINKINEKDNNENVLGFMDLIENNYYSNIYKSAQNMIEMEYLTYDAESTDPEGNVVKQHVVGISELEERLQNSFNSEDEILLNTKKETINFLTDGHFSNKRYEGVDYDAIFEVCKNKSTDYCISQDKNVKNLISFEISKIKNNDSEYYLTLNEQQINDFFNELDRIVNDNFCSECIKTELELYKNEILDVRNDRKIREANRDLLDSVDDICDKHIEIKQINYNVNSFELFFTAETVYSNASDYNDNDKYYEKYSELSEKINRNKVSYDKYVKSLYKKAALLIEEHQKLNDFFQILDNTKETVSSFEKEYAEIVEKCNGKNEDSYFSIVKSLMENYNSVVENVSEKYSILENARHNEDVCREIYDWAENEYLHLDYKYENMLSPEEKYYEAAAKYEEAQNALNVFNDKHKDSEFSERFRLFDENGNNVFEQYENVLVNYCAANVFYSEMQDSIIDQIEKLEKAKKDERKYYSKLLKEDGNKSFEINDLVRNFVKIELVNKGTDAECFNISLNENNEIKESEYQYSDEINRYLSEKTLDLFDGSDSECYISVSDFDAVQFLIDLSNKKYTLNDLLLSVCRLKMNSSDTSLFFEGENPEQDYNYSLGSLGESLYQFNIPEEYHNSRLDVINEAYEKVCKNNGKDDIAKLIFYSSYCLNDAFDFNDREVNYLSKCALEKVHGKLMESALKHNDTGLEYSIAASGLAAISWIPGLQYAAAVAAGLFVSADTEFRCYRDITDYCIDIKNVMDGYQILIDESLAESDVVFSKWIESKSLFEEEAKKLNQMLYANDEPSYQNISFETYDEFVRKVFNSSANNSIGYDYLSNLYLKSSCSSFRQLFDNATFNKNCTSVFDITECIFDYINNLYEKECSIVAENIEKNRNNDNWNEAVYQREIGKINYDNLIVNVPYNINREQEPYITEGLKNIEECYDRMLVEYYKNLLIQKENEYDLVKEKLSQQIFDWDIQFDNSIKTAETEWNNAEKKFNESFSLWNNEWKNNYLSKESQLNEQYNELLSKKTEWINKYYTEQAYISDIDFDSEYDIETQFDQIRLKAEEIIKNENIDIYEVLDNCSIENLCTISSFDELSKNIDSLNSRALHSCIEIFSANKMNVFELERTERINSSISEINEKIEKIVALKSAEEALSNLTDKCNELYEEVELKNKAFENWEKSLVLKDGYKYGDEIYRYAIVNSNVFDGNVRQKQIVHKYEYFNYIRPQIDFSLVNAEDCDSISYMLERNYEVLSDWHRLVFGSQNEKGLFAKHIGDAPEFVENVNTKINRVENISKPGNGQLGLVMLDYIWNSAVSRDGYAELGIPLYDKKITKDNVVAGIELPTLRTITSMVCDIVGNGTGQVWVSAIDDFLFGTMDLQFKRKTEDQFIQDMLKAGVSAGLSSAASGALKSVSDSSLDKLSKVAVNSGIKSAQTYANSIAGSYIDSMKFKDGFSIDWDKANSVWFNEDAVRNSIVSGITYSTESLLNSALNEFTLQDGLKKYLNPEVFDVSAIQSLNKTVSSIAAAGVEKVLTGKSAINILTAGDLGIKFWTKDADGNYIKTDPASDTGLFALTIDDSGIKSKISTEGIMIGAKQIIESLGGIGDSISLINAKVQSAIGNDEYISKVNGINCLSVYPSEEAVNLARQIWKNKNFVKYANMDALGRTKDNVIDISDKIIGNDEEAAALFASLVLHENAHINGADEFQARLAGYNAYGMLSQLYDTSSGKYDSVSDVGFYTEVLKKYGEQGVFYLMNRMNVLNERNDEWSNYLAKTIDSEIRQNNDYNNLIVLGDALVKQEVDKYNIKLLKNAYDKYMQDGFNDYLEKCKNENSEKDHMSYNDFCTSGTMKYENFDSFSIEIDKENKELSNYFFEKQKFISIGQYGCVLSTATYIAYSLTGKVYTLEEANQICKENDVYNGAYINWGENYKKAVNSLIGENALTSYERASSFEDKQQMLNEIESSDEGYFIIARVLDDSHAVLLESEQKDYGYINGKKVYKSLSVINSWTSSNKNSKLAKKNYSMGDISNLTYYKIDAKYLEMYKKFNQLKESYK